MAPMFAGNVYYLARQSPPKILNWYLRKLTIRLH